MELDNFSGHVQYDDDIYVFTFEDFTIQLIPGDPNKLITHKANYFNKYFGGNIKDGFIEDAIIYGRSFDGKKIAFCISDFPNGELKFSVKWVYKFYNNEEDIKIKGINYTSQEINYFYDLKKYVSDDVDYNEKGSINTFTMNINSLERTNFGNFKYKDNKFYVFGDMAFKKNYDVSNNLELWSKITIESDKEIDNLNNIYEITLLQKNVIDFLTYRTNNTFDLIETYGFNSNNKKRTIGLFYISDECNRESNYKNVKQLITSNGINDLGKLYNLIANNKLYLHHICSSFKSRSIYTVPRMLGIMIAFERIINWKYDREKLRNESYIELLNRIKKLSIDHKKELCECLPKNKIKFDKTIEKQFEAAIPFSTYIMKVIKDYPISLSFIANIYVTKNPEKMKSEIADRINILRNDMAHGKMDARFDQINTKDIKFMEMMVYILALSEIGLPEDEIINKVIWLFNIKPFMKIK